ncbi:LIM domain-containing protein 2 [Elsinoe fawcettii]|nr:LIM domain-containing protein 2 [Elsinoe fawcettii]
MLARSQDGKDSKNTSGNFMSDGQLADYLADLRTSRAARLNGSRPIPPSRFDSQKRAEPSKTGRDSPSEYAGRPLVPAPLRISSPAPKIEEVDAAKVPNNLATSPSVIYMENGARWMDRQEAKSLRMALEDMDLEEERRIHDAAQDEASQLVMEHKHPSKKTEISAYANPDAPKRDYKVHLRKGSYGRSHSPIPDLSGSTRNSSPNKPRESWGNNTALNIGSGDIAKPVSISPVKGDAKASDPSQVTQEPARPQKKKTYQGLANAVAADIASLTRRVSSGGKRKASSEKRMFPTAEDRIYEEPEPIKEEEVIEPVKKVAPVPIPVETSSSDLPRHMRKNPFARVKFNKDNLERANSIASGQTPRFNPIEIQRNVPSQSRRPWYMSNKPASAPVVPQSKGPELETEDQADEVPKMKDGKEIRSDDIRAATSMRRTDRSPNLPQPTAVSDSPGRPIVSFTNGWQKKEAEREGNPSPLPNSRPASRPGSQHALAGTSPVTSPVKTSPVRSTPPRPQPSIPSPRALPNVRLSQHPPVRTNTAPAAVSIPNGIPILNLPDDDDGMQSKVLSEEPDLPQMNLLLTNQEPRKPHPSPQSTRKMPSIPTITAPDEHTHVTGSKSTHPQPPQSARPLPVPQQSRAQPASDPGPHLGSRPLPSTKPLVTPTQARTGALCAHCALPIAGRILSAAGERFHPECFACHQCGINLECVAFYPEPDQRYYERIARIQHRMQGYDIAVPEGVSAEDVRRLEEQDGDESMRFFCHLDFHELFSPRCKSCKTPIEGEVVVACGAEWHVGHFFCAQCGDPFDSNTPFVEKDGYAWCLGCHTHRYSPKCRKCRKPITDLVVNALEYDWHSHCFCCAECGGGFDDGQYFLRGDSTDPVCIWCEDRRLKANTTSTFSQSPSLTHKTPVRSKKENKSHAASLVESIPQSAASDPTGGPAARYFTPALFPRRIDSLGQTTDRPSLPRGRSDSNSSESYYYTATWNTPNDPSFQSGPSSRRPHTSGKESGRDKRGALPAGFVFGLDHLVPSRLPQSLFGDSVDGPLSPTVAKQLRASQKLSEQSAGLFGDQQDFLTQARGVPVEQIPPKTKVATAAMLASRWAPTPDREMHEKEQTEKADKMESTPQSTPVKSKAQSIESPRPQSIRRGTGETPKDSPRKKKKVLWNGRQCVIYLPSGSPERFGGARPMSLEQVSNLLRGWQASGHDTNGFDVQHSENPEIEADRGRLRYVEAQDLFTSPTGSRPVVRIANPKAWQDYTNWLMEEKLRALGVGGADEPPVMSRETSNQQQSRTFSPSFNASAAGSHGFPFSQRSTPGLSNFSTGPHSRTMSIASPLSSGPEPRGHAHRHSVFGMPQAFQQLSGLSPNMRPFSPSQQLSLNAVARAHSPIDRLKGSVSPVPQSAPPLDGHPFRPSPVGERRFTPPTHMRHQSLAPTFSPRQTPVAVTPQQALAGVPEDEEEGPQEYTPRAPVQPSEIVVPTPRGHRHNISENLEKEIRDAERMMEQQSAFEVPKPPQHQAFGQFGGPGQDSFSFKPPVQMPTPGQFQFGAPPNVPSFQPQAFAFQQQAPFGQPPFNPQQAAFQPHAQSFNFNPGMAPRAQSFQPGSLANMFQQAPASRPPLPGHTRQKSSGNLDVSAPAFKPQSFGAPSLPSKSFDFSSGFEFKPGAQSFQPPAPAQSAPAQTSIFGEVNIPEVVKPARKSKAVAIIRPISSHKNDNAAAVEEDESGRLIQSTDRQKRAFRAAEDDGDAIPLFAERPASPARADEAGHVIAKQSVDSTLPIQGNTDGDEPAEEKSLDDSAMDVDGPALKDVEDDEPLNLDERSSVLGYSTDENKENAPIQSGPAVISGGRVSHARNLSSLSALAKPFEFVPKSQPAQNPPLRMPANGAQSSSEVPVTLDPEKPDFTPARVFSRDVTTIDGGLSNAFEPEKSIPSPLREATPPQLAELSFEPSFDEIDAVMRQLNEEDDEPVAESNEAVEVSRLDTDELRPSSPFAMTSQAGPHRSDAPSPGSVKIHPIREGRPSSVSSLSSEAPLDLPSPMDAISPTMQGPRNRNLGPSSEWSEDFSSGAGDRIRQRSGFFDDRVDEVIGKALQEHLQPLKEQMDTLRRSLSEARPVTASSQPRRVPSSGLDSDADDEDDIADSKFLPRPLSSRGGRKYDMMKAAVAEALTQRPASPIKDSHADLLHGFEMVNSRLDTLLVKGFDIQDVREAVEEAMQKQSTSLVHVPRQDSSDTESEVEIYRRENFDTKKLLRLAEEELDLLRASISDKDGRLELLERERRDLRDRAENGEELADRYRRKASDLEAESTTLHSTLEEYRALRLKLKHDQEDAEAENRHLRASLADLEGQVADGRKVRDNMREKLDRIQTDMAGAAEQIANQKVGWQRQNEELQKRCAVYQSRLDAESQLRLGLENEVARLRMIASEGESAKGQLEQSARTNAMLEETIQALRDEVNEVQTSNSRVHRELQDARENSRLEVQRAQLMMQAGIETANTQADATRAGLESKLSITHNELDNLKALMEAMKSRHEILLQEEADLRRDTLLKVNEASNSALENLRARHEEDIHFIRNQHERQLSDARQDKDRSEHFWNERLTMSEERHSHLRERITHLEERLSIAKSAASAAALAAQQAARPSTSTISREPERISPQALRESILVLQEQLQDRESQIEQLTSTLNTTQSTLPAKLKEKDIEINWLRELLAVRADDLKELISTLDDANFNRDAARDAAIRIQTQMQIEIQEKERHIKAGDSLPAQALAGLTNFASPKAVQLAAAFGSWRARGAPSGPTPRSVRRQGNGSRDREMRAVEGAGASPAPGSVIGPKREERRGDRKEILSSRMQEGTDETPSKSNPPRPGSAASWMSGLMTPPASGLRRTPSPTFDKGLGVDTPGATPLSLRRGSFDEDAGEVGFEGVDGGGSLAQELEPLG